MKPCDPWMMSQNSGEEKKPWPTCPSTGARLDPGVLCCGLAFGCPRARGWEHTPQASEKPSNEQKQFGGHPEYLKVIEERRALHIEKSSGYGTGKDPFANFTSVAELTGMPRWVYPMLRAEEKIQRCWSLYTQKRFSELEEEFTDISSLFDCATAMLREDQEETDDLSFK